MATASDSVGSIDNATDFFNCPICLERFKTPKCLPCQHSFCEACLQTYIQSSESDGKSMSSFLCPFCRQPVNPPDPNSRPSEWAGLFPTNGVVEIPTTVQTSGRLCGPCERDNESSQGALWCSGCLEYYCETCAKYHKRIKSLKAHKLIPVGEMEELMAPPLTEIDEPCQDHPEEVIKVYCEDHKKLCCVICLTNNHRDCKEIISLNEIVAKMKDNFASEIIDQLEDMKEKAIKVAENKMENVKYLNKRHQDITDEVDTLIEDTKSKLDNLKKNFQLKLNTLHKQNEMKCTETIEKIATMEKTLDDGVEIIKAVSSVGPSKQVFIAVEKAKSHVGVNIQRLKLNPENDNEIDYDLNIDNDLKAIAWEKSLLEVKAKSVPCAQKIMEVAETINSLCEIKHLEQNQVLDADITDLAAVRLWDVQGDGWLTGAAFLSDGTLVCCNHLTPDLRAFDPLGDGKSLCTQELQYHPDCLAVDTENQVFVTGYEKSFLKTYSFDDAHFTELKTIAVPTTTRGLGIADNKIILACEKNIEIVTLLGKKIVSIPIDDQIPQTRFVATELGMNCFVYLVDKTAMILSLDGREVGKHVLPNSIHTPKGIAFDHKRNIFVGDSSSKNICVVSSDYKKNCILFTTSIQPDAIGFDTTGMRFFVTASKDEKDPATVPLVEVYGICLKSNR